MTDRYTFRNPVTAYDHIEPPKQHQPEPGLDAELVPRADLGEESYRGTGRLEGRKAIVTGADSGIGAAAAIAFAREGADVVLSYLPEEEEDAARVAGLIEKAGRKAVRVPGDLKDAAMCRVTQYRDDVTPAGAHRSPISPPPPVRPRASVPRSLSPASKEVGLPVGQLCEQLANYREAWPSKLKNGQVPWNLTVRGRSRLP